MMTLKKCIEVNSNLGLEIAKERIFNILEKRKYGNIKITYNTISFDNGMTIFGTASKHRESRVERGTFYFIEERDEISVKLTYEISYMGFLLTLLIGVVFGSLISVNFFFITGFAVILWPFSYLLIKYEAEELISVCQNKPVYNS
jgi:hypothetical protein